MSYQPCYPNPPQTALVTGGGYGQCGFTEYRRVIGYFTQDINLGSMAEAFIERCGRLQTNTPVTFEKFIADLLIFNSQQVSFNASAQNNQICMFTITLNNLMFGAGASHWTEVPVYCNVVQQLPGAGLEASRFGWPQFNSLVIPGTTGQFNLQYNVFLNSGAVFGATPTGQPILVVNILPLLSRINILRNTPIFCGNI